MKTTSILIKKVVTTNMSLKYVLFKTKLVNPKHQIDVPSSFTEGIPPHGNNREGGFFRF